MPYRQNFPIPAVIDPPKQCLQIMIPNHPDWKAVISGLLFELAYWFNWERTGDMSGAECAAVWKQVYNSIDWSDMSCCCGDVQINVRINPTTGLVEQTSDGGDTWQPQPGNLQSVIVEPPPPITAGLVANKCDAAANVENQIEAWIAQVTGDFDTATSLTEFAIGVLEAILVAVLAVLSLGALTPLEALVLPTIGAAAAAAYAAGKSAFVDYWTGDVLDNILCIAFCNIGDDGSFSDTQFSAFWNQVNSDLPPSPAKMLFMGFLSSTGRQGLNAMAASAAITGADCSDCPCAPCVDVWGWPTAFVAQGASYTVGDDYIQAEATLDGGWYYWVLWTESAQCCDVTVTSIVALDPATTAFCGKMPCDGGDYPTDWNFGAETSPWVNDALAPPHGTMKAIKIRASYPFTARATFA